MLLFAAPDRPALWGFPLSRRVHPRNLLAEGSVDAAAVTDLDHEDDELLIADLADQAKVSDAVTPETRQVGRQSLATVPWA